MMVPALEIPPQALEIAFYTVISLTAFILARWLIGSLIDRISQRLGGLFRLVTTAATIIILPIMILERANLDLLPTILLYSLTLILLNRPLREIFSGDALRLNGTVSKGDYVEVGDLGAKVIAVRTFATELMTADLRKIYVPNSVLMTSKIVNLTKSGAGIVTLRVRVDGRRIPIADAKVVMLKTGVDIAKSEMASGRAAEVKVVGVDGDNVDLQLTLYISNPAKAESLTPIIMERIYTKLSDVAQRAYL